MNLKVWINYFIYMIFPEIKGKLEKGTFVDFIIITKSDSRSKILLFHYTQSNAVGKKIFLML